MEFIRQPWAHQLEAMKRAHALYQKGGKLDPQDAGFGLFFEPGAGKSGTAINILRQRMTEEKRFYRTLIFCPPIVVPNWKEEWRLNSKIPQERIVLLTGPGKRRLQTFQRYAWKPLPGMPNHGSLHENVIFVTNYESLLMEDLYDEFNKWCPDAIIFDEAHKLKNPAAKRSKLAHLLANPKIAIPHKLILTGSPVLKDPMDLFMQFQILDGGRTFGNNFFIFRARYFRDRNAGMPKERYFPDWQPMTLAKDGFDTLTEINKLIQSRTMHVKKEDCLDLPPFVRQVIKVGMSPPQAKAYAEMKRDFITIVQDKACTAQLAITKALRLQQIASGYVKVVDGEEIALDGSPKIEALSELLSELTPNHKVLVWAVWKQNYQEIRALCQKLGIKCVEVHGEVSETQRNEAVRALNHDPDTRVLIGHPGSGGIGINLIAASYSIFYSRTFSLEHSIQAEARNYRGGSEVHEKVTRYDLVTENTIDELVTEKLANKIEISDKLIGDLSLLIQNQET